LTSAQEIDDGRSKRGGKRKARAKTHPDRPALFEIVRELPAPPVIKWTALGGALLPLIAKGRDLLDGLYIVSARTLLEGKHRLEDWSAERRVRERDRIRRRER
jgi:hypothetical protein